MEFGSDLVYAWKSVFFFISVLYILEKQMNSTKFGIMWSVCSCYTFGEIDAAPECWSQDSS